MTILIPNLLAIGRTLGLPAAAAMAILEVWFWASCWWGCEIERWEVGQWWW
jgi:hypothetical protein